jgi:hypothetical protein
VWVEVQLQRLLAAAKAGRCEDALDGAQNLGSEVPGLAFTRDGLEPTLQSARTNYLLASAFSTCGKPDVAKEKLQLAARASAPDQIRWAWLAAQKLPKFDQAQWQARLKTALEQTTSRSETSAYPSWWMYNAGMLATDLGRADEGKNRFRQALLLPDRMLAYHMTRLAKSENPSSARSATPSSTE